MGLFNFKKKDDYDSMYNISLNDLKMGFTLDYLMKNWEVKNILIYDWGEEEFTKEFVLESGIDTIHLEVEVDDNNKPEYTLWRKFSLEEIDSGLKQAIIDNDEAPTDLEYENNDYQIKETSQGWCSEEGNNEADEFVNWIYQCSRTMELISIDRWDEEEFEAAKGRKVKELDFANILSI